MVLLAIDTATRMMGVALYDGKTVLAEQMWIAGNQHNSLLASAVQASFQICGVASADIRAVAVTHGPGSYTGLRIGVAFAKGIAGANRLPLIGVSTLDVLATPQPISTKNKLLCVVQAGRGRVICGTYQTKKGRWQLDGEFNIVEWANLLPTIDTPTLISGEIDDEAHALITQSNHPHITVLSGASRVRRTGVLAEEAWRRWQNGTEKDFLPAKLTPIYMGNL
jgi:tRNA threonylcarbamoyladenosine biosynthesis protein TsaB